MGGYGCEVGFVFVVVVYGDFDVVVGLLLL